MTYRADLHIHTLLSPCGEIEMIPNLIIEAAQEAGLDIIGIADHNSCENAGAVMEAAIGSGIKALPGLEVQSVEGVHLLCLFDSIEQAEEMQHVVYKALPRIEVTAKLYEQQMVVDYRAEFVNFCTIPISVPTSLEIDEVFERVYALGGILIPSHIDRLETGMCGVLGMLPDSPEFEAVEISKNITPDAARERYPSVGDRPIFQNSDAHWLSAIGECRTLLEIEHRTISEIRLACRSEGGRRVINA